MACVRQQPFSQQHFSSPSAKASTKTSSKRNSEKLTGSNKPNSNSHSHSAMPHKNNNANPMKAVSSEDVVVNAMPPPPSRLSTTTTSEKHHHHNGPPTMLTAEHRVVSSDYDTTIEQHHHQHHQQHQQPCSTPTSFQRKRKANNMYVSTKQTSTKEHLPVMAMKSPISTCLSLILGAAETIAKRDEANNNESADTIRDKAPSTSVTSSTAVLQHEESKKQPSSTNTRKPHAKNNTFPHKKNMLFPDYRHVSIPSPSFDEEPSYHPPQPYHPQQQQPHMHHHHSQQQQQLPNSHHPSFHHHNTTKAASMHPGSMHHHLQHHHAAQQHHALHAFNASAPMSSSTTANSRVTNPAFHRHTDMHTYTPATTTTTEADNNKKTLKNNNNDPIEIQMEDPTVYKNLILTMALQRPRVKEPKSGAGDTSSQQEHQILAPPSKVIGEGFYWKEYPALENLLYSHMGEYYEWSTRSRQSKHQQAFNNALVEKVRSIAAAEGFSFDSYHFTDKRLRDRIRCFFKTHLQNAKKRLNTLKKNVNSKDNRSCLQDLLQQARQVQEKAQRAQPLIRTVSITSEEEAVAVSSGVRTKKRRRS